MKFFKKYLFWLVTLLLPILYVPAASQSINANNLQTINVDDLSDEQIKKFIAQAEKGGYTEDQLILGAKSRGMSELQIQKLRSRINQIQMGIGLQQGQTSDVSRLRESPVLNEEVTVPFDPFDEINEGKQVPESRIFGLRYFTNSNLTFEPSINMPTPKNYQLGPGDQVIIDIWGASEQSYQEFISPDGFIKLPRLGPIYVSGLDIDDAKRKINGKLKKVYQTLGSTTYSQISLGQIRTIRVHVIGEVKVPGTYTVSSFGNAFNALYLAGGPNENGTLRQIEIYRAGKLISTMDAYRFLIYGEGENVNLIDGDVVMIKPYQIRVDITGQVKRSALYELKERETLNDLIEFAGGFTDRAYTENISVRRIDENFRTLKTFALTDSAELENGDQIQIQAVSNKFVNRVRIEGALNFPGSFEFEEGLMLSEVIDLAGGITGDAFLQRGLIIRLEEDYSLKSEAFDLSKVLAGEINIELRNEDQIKIQSIYELKQTWNVQIQGEVIRPGTFPFIANMTVEDLVFLAGGFKESASRATVEVARRVKDDDVANKADIFNFSINEALAMESNASDFKLEPFDLIVIRQSPGYESQEMIELEGEVLYPGRYALKSKTETIYDIIQRAGGLTPYAYPEGAMLVRRSEYFETDEDDGDTRSRIRRNEIANFLLQDTLSQFDKSFHQQERVGIELEKILINPSSKFNMTLKRGDVISVPGELETVRVRGEVLNSGKIKYDRQNLKDYISGCGGFTQTAKKNKIYVIYANGKTNKTNTFMGIRKYPPIYPGTEIIVPGKPEKQNKLSAPEMVAMMSALASMALVIDRLSQ